MCRGVGKEGGRVLGGPQWFYMSDYIEICPGPSPTLCNTGYMAPISYTYTN